MAHFTVYVVWHYVLKQLYNLKINIIYINYYHNIIIQALLINEMTILCLLNE